MLNIGKAASEDVYSSIIYNGEREMEGVRQEEKKNNFTSQEIILGEQY